MAQQFYEFKVLDIRPDFDGVEHGQTDDFDFSKVGIGPGTPWKPTTTVKRRLMLPYLLASHAEFRELRDYIVARKGQREGFWVPTFINDYWLTQNELAGATTLTIKAVGLSAIVSPSNKTQFNFLALVTRGEIRCHEITNAVLSGGNEVLTVSPAISGAVIADDTVCCALIFARLEDDKVDYNFSSDGVSRASLRLEELPKEYRFTDGVGGYTGVINAGLAPIYLYEFTRSGTVYRLADWGVAVEANGETWAAENITHGGLASALDFVADEVELEVATDRADHPLRYYLDREATEMTTVKIFELAEGATTFDATTPIFKGRVDVVDFGEEGKINVTMTAITRLAGLKLPVMDMQRTCNHRVFDVNCSRFGLLEATFTTAGTISVINSDPPYVEAVAFGTKSAAQGDPNWFALGKVTVGNEVRLCVGTPGSNRLYLNMAFKNALVGQAISATAGCDKRIGTCGPNKFNNLLAMIATPYMPNKNPTVQALTTPKPAGGKKS